MLRINRQRRLSGREIALLLTRMKVGSIVLRGWIESNLVLIRRIMLLVDTFAAAYSGNKFERRQMELLLLLK